MMRKVHKEGLVSPRGFRGGYGLGGEKRQHRVDGCEVEHCAGSMISSRARIFAVTNVGRICAGGGFLSVAARLEPTIGVKVDRSSPINEQPMIEDSPQNFQPDHRVQYDRRITPTDDFHDELSD
jgi:hypothetical protein